jgi:hypothetical protein
VHPVKSALHIQARYFIFQAQHIQFVKRMPASKPTVKSRNGAVRTLSESNRLGKMSDSVMSPLSGRSAAPAAIPPTPYRQSLAGILT